MPRIFVCIKVFFLLILCIRREKLFLLKLSACKKTTQTVILKARTQDQDHVYWARPVPKTKTSSGQCKQCLEAGLESQTRLESCSPINNKLIKEHFVHTQTQTHTHGGRFRVAIPPTSFVLGVNQSIQQKRMWTWRTEPQILELWPSTQNIFVTPLIIKQGYLKFSTPACLRTKWPPFHICFVVLKCVQLRQLYIHVCRKSNEALWV